MKRRREFTDDVYEPGLALALLGKCIFLFTLIWKIVIVFTSSYFTYRVDVHLEYNFYKQETVTIILYFVSRAHHDPEL